MAIAFVTNGQILTRTTGLIAASSDYSCILTFRPGATPSGTKRTVWAMRNAGYTAYVRLVSAASANTYRIEADNGAGGTGNTASATFEADIRGSIAYTRSGTTHTFYCNGDSVGNFTLDISGVTFANEVLGDDGLSVAGLEIQYFREWNSALTLAQIFAEWNSPTDIVASDTDTPLVSDLLDDSGNGHDWGATGSPGFVDGPTPLPRTNTSSGTAYTIPSLPASIYQVAKDSTGSTTDLWYSYAVSGESMLNVFGVGAITGDYDFVTELYDDPLDAALLGTTNRALQYPVTDGTTYYIRLDKPAIPANMPGAAWLSVVGFTNTTVPTGAIVVPSDGVVKPVPEVRIDPDSGALLRCTYPPKGIGEQGDILPSGIFLMTNLVVSDQLELYSATSALITTIPFDWEGREASIRACTDGNKFYVSTGGTVSTNSTIATVLPDGSLGPLTWTVGQKSVRALAASNDETVLYYATATGTNATIFRWDLLTNTALADFLPDVSGYFITDIIILTDDTILLGYSGVSLGDYIVRRYNAAGTLLNTYNFGNDVSGAGSDVARLATAINDPDSFWVWLHDDNTDPTTARFIEIETATGSTLREQTLAEYGAGVQDGSEAAEPGTPRPSVQSSCPFFIARTSGSSGGIVVTKTTVPATDTTSFDITAGGGAIPATFSLANGESQILTATPGSGYSITETVDADEWLTTYQVSNGSPVSNITVADGETVTVTITNQTYIRLPIRWVRTTPTVIQENNRIFIPLIELDCQVGVGNASGDAENTDPLVMVEQSTDGGYTWGTQRTIAMGEIGEYGELLRLYRWDAGRRQTFRFSGSAAVPVVLTDCYITAEPGRH